MRISTEALLARIEALERQIKQCVVQVGPGLESRRSGAGTFISLLTSPLDTGRGASKPDDKSSTIGSAFPVRITAYQLIGPSQWRYTFRKVQRGSAVGPYGVPNSADGGWRNTKPEITGEAAVAQGLQGYCYNLVENMNSDPSASGSIQGNGVDTGSAGFPTGFAIMPCPVGNVVFIHGIGDEYWFQYENGVDGSC